MQALAAKGFVNASPIQELTIPHILEGTDIFAQAETGSGKTGSFAIPILELLLRSENKQQLYIVLSPTRELAQQTHQVFVDFATPLDIKVACFIGGESFDKQKTALEAKPQVLVATPGRFVDLIKQKLIDLSECTGVVFDEADRLFDMGFKKDIEYVLSKVRPDRQLIMVSATSNQDVLRTAYHFRSHPLELKLNADDLLVETINHQVAMISQEEKMPYLVHLLRENIDAYAIVFCNTQFMTHLVAEWLGQMGFKAKPISGRMPQNKRTKLMEEFRSKEITILVCTDVAARGLDIKDVNLVINYDMPSEAANYVHRIGRTGRAGKSGLAISFCAFEDCENLDAISKYIGSNIPKADIEDEHFAKDIPKRPYLDAKSLKVVEREKDRGKDKSKDRSKERNKERSRTREQERRPRAERPVKEVREQAIPVEKTAAETVATGTRVLELSGYNLEGLKAQAMKHFALHDPDLLQWKVLVEGRKKFFLFGPKLNKISFSIKPFYRKVWLPFFIELFKKMDLKIYVRVTYKEPHLRVQFSGQDAKVLIENRFALQNAIEQISLIYLEKRVMVPKDTKIVFKTDLDGEVESKSGRPSQSRGRDRSRDDRGRHRERTGIGQDKEKELAALVEKTKAQVLASGSAVTLESMDPAQRRVVHQLISDDPKFKSSSLGEGRFKQIQISLNDSQVADL